MDKYKTKNVKKMIQYHTALMMAFDKKSSLWNSDGSPNLDAPQRAAFWNGYQHGMEHSILVPRRSSDRYVVFRAGIDFRTHLTSQGVKL